MVIPTATTGTTGFPTGAVPGGGGGFGRWPHRWDGAHRGHHTPSRHRPRPADQGVRRRRDCRSCPRGRRPQRRAGRVRRDHGRVGLRQVDADEHHRLPRRAHRRDATASTASTSSELGDDQLADVRNHKIGFVFQSFNLLPRTSRSRTSSCRSSTAASRAASGASRAIEALARVGLGDRMDHQPTELSGGQQQRVAIARALVTEPGAAPRRRADGSLDSQSSAEVIELLDDLHAGEPHHRHHARARGRRARRAGRADA